MKDINIILNPIIAVYYIVFIEIAYKFKTCLKQEYAKSNY